LGAAWLATFVLFAAVVGWGRFAGPDSIQTLVRQAAIVAVASVGATFVIVRGGIDLSVGSVVALVTVVTARCVASGWHPVVAAVGGVAAGAAVGVANGLVVRWLRVSPFIATLGTLLAVRGLAKGLAGDQKIDAPLTMLRWLMSKLPAASSWLVVPAGVWLTALLAVAGTAVLARTRFGREVVACGSNEEAASLAGLPVGANLVGVFALAGVMSGVAGLLQFSRLTVGDPTVAVGLELDVVAAVVIGGASLLGGRGSVAGAGCSQWGLPNWVQEIVTGAIIVGAVAADRLRVGGPQ
jgi:ribose/xylose/arabinose/galactoside ABC-type transport system permease subunit